jgi:hypothetical protein
MIEPLTTMATSRILHGTPFLESFTNGDSLAEALFRDFSESTRTANKEVSKFTTLMSDEETKKIFEQGRKSRIANPDDIKPWRAIDHPDWLTRDV